MPYLKDDNGVGSPKSFEIKGTIYIYYILSIFVKKYGYGCYVVKTLFGDCTSAVS